MEQMGLFEAMLSQRIYRFFGCHWIPALLGAPCDPGVQTRQGRERATRIIRAGGNHQSLVEPGPEGNRPDAACPLHHSITMSFDSGEVNTGLHHGHHSQ